MCWRSSSSLPTMAYSAFCFASTRCTEATHSRWMSCLKTYWHSESGHRCGRFGWLSFGKAGFYSGKERNAATHRLTVFQKHLHSFGKIHTYSEKETVADGFHSDMIVEGNNRWQYFRKMVFFGEGSHVFGKRNRSQRLNEMSTFLRNMKPQY